MRKRNLSHLEKGALSAFGSVAFVGLCLFPALSELATKPSAGLLRSLVQIGGAFLIAWSIQAALSVRASHYRDSTQESIIGSMMGLAASGLLGIIVALALSERAEAGHWIWADRLAFSLVSSALIFLGICIVLLVYFTYEWSRQGRIDPPE